MDLSADLINYFCLPYGAYLDYQAALSTHQDIADDHDSIHLDSLLPAQPSWRIDGCDGQGTQFLALPIFLSPNLVPLRVDVYIPDQTKHPTHLRKALGSAGAFCIRDQRVNSLGITKLVLLALERWTAEQEDFAARFHALPFGSRIILENITDNVEDIRVRMVADHKTERQLLPVSKLQQLWGDIPIAGWPETISLTDLEHCRQLHDTISLVRIKGGSGDQFFIFKSSVNEVRYVYHELKLLLTMPPHPNIIPRPLFLVTGADRYGGEDKVYGFLMEHHQQGNLADILAYRSQMGTLTRKDQFRWAREIASTLIEINNGPAGFYSELKPDNLLLSCADDRTETETEERVVFIDFEQLGNWFTLSAPEVHYLEWVLKLSKCNEVPEDERRRFAQLVDDHMPIQPAGDPIYDNPAAGYYRPWMNFSAAEQEAAEVFSLGKTLWCVFEGRCDTRNSILKAFKHHDDDDSSAALEFPHFRATPEPVRQLIRECTRGNRDGESGRVEVVRRGWRVYPRGRSGIEGEPLGTAREAMEAARRMWQQRIAEMEEFLAARTRWQRGEGREGDVELLGYPGRPSLREVVNRLTIIADECVDTRKVIH
ncbi:uncharacterized protein BJX67DRAFT_379021 [Aspergillus lucknowensis]|uniref:Protein kinase domain-containing protein n=1 Tax=Aspergillus lucknowensis TaxID=176173 RepID=A0ABR4LY39_9EURO